MYIYVHTITRYIRSYRTDVTSQTETIFPIYINSLLRGEFQDCYLAIHVYVIRVLLHARWKEILAEGNYFHFCFLFVLFVEYLNYSFKLFIRIQRIPTYGYNNTFLFLVIIRNDLD